MKEIEIVIVDSAHVVEYYCTGCKQLRLWCKPERLDKCQNCGSVEAIFAKPNSSHLSRLRFGKSV